MEEMERINQIESVKSRKLIWAREFASELMAVSCEIERQMSLKKNDETRQKILILRGVYAALHFALVSVLDVTYETLAFPYVMDLPAASTLDCVDRIIDAIDGENDPITGTPKI
jgi:hypothetical protein